jgi:hypothetical protein
MFTAGQMLRAPGVSPLVLAGQARLTDQLTFGQFVADPTNLSAIQHNAKRRKGDLMSKYCRAILATQELELALQNTVNSTTPIGARTTTTALVPFVRPQPVQPPPQLQQAPQGQHHLAVPPGPAPGQHHLAAPPQPQPFESWSSWVTSAFKAGVSWTFATVKVRILTVVCVLIFPQLVMKLFMRCARLAVITLSTEAANTLVAASDAMDHALDPMLGAMSEPFSAFNVITPPMDNGTKTHVSVALGAVSFVLCRWLGNLGTVAAVLGPAAQAGG